MRAFPGAGPALSLCAAQSPAAACVVECLCRLAPCSRWMLTRCRRPRAIVAAASMTSRPSAPPNARPRARSKPCYRADVRRAGDWVIFDFHANAFLHHMVRNLVGHPGLCRQGGAFHPPRCRRGVGQPQPRRWRRRPSRPPAFISLASTMPRPSLSQVKSRVPADSAFYAALVMSRTAIKICGLTRKEDLLNAIDAGADADRAGVLQTQSALCESCQGARVGALGAAFGLHGRSLRQCD